MFHLFASEVAAFASMVLFVLMYGVFYFFDIGWAREPTAVDVFVLICSCIFACRTAAKGKVCQWPSGVDFTNRVALVVGATSGVGYSTAMQLAEHGWTVVLAARNIDRLLFSKKAIDRYLQRCNAKGSVKVLGTVDLRSDASIRAYVKDLAAVKAQLPVGLLIMAAGAMHRHLHFVGELEELRIGKASVAASSTAWRSIECMIAANAVGPYLFTQLMLPLLDETAERTSVTSRIVNVASSCHSFLGPGRQARYSPVEMIHGLDERAAEVLPGDGSGEAKKGKTARGPYYIRDYSWASFVGYYGLSKLCVMWNTRLLARQVATMRFIEKTAAKTPALRKPTTNPSPTDPAQNITATPETARQDQLKIFVACTHPGIITTYLYRDIFAPWMLDYLLYYPSLVFGKTWFESAQSTLKAAVEDTGMVQGGYYLCSGEYGPESGVNCVSAHTQSLTNMEEYRKWLMARVVPALKPESSDTGTRNQDEAFLH
ncbi:putative short chain dehydrogenase/Enoyl-(Acyl carrier protein) reductase [Leishmania shawi]|uniref:Short chain dehydrogenase/Enoyl-(Acyl carrier protein) reductase n=1 Tax=Leishmania shawi TaxID=5680 RepID=A0AAW3B9Z6_9TRYP